jgi:hypothetical protein
MAKMAKKALADLVVRELKTSKEVHRVALNSLSESHVERVMMGMLRNMSERFYIDDSEVDDARKKMANGGTNEPEHS